VGFALWIDRDVAWAAGTYEYRAMGAAVISRTDLFRAVDFQRERRAPAAADPSFVGNFASLGQVNEHLKRARRSTKMGN
jgi:hypothetical protein